MKNGEKPIANPFVLLREEFDDWAILFNPDTGRGFGLSPTGVYVWKLLDGECSIDDMLTALRRDSEDVPGEAGNQIMAFLEELARHGLVGRKEEPGCDDKRRLSPSSERFRMIRFPYEPPVLVNLRGQQQAAGYYCINTGSQNSDGCNANGNLASCCGYGSGGSTNPDCCSGSCPGCSSGTSCCGTCAGGIQSLTVCGYGSDAVGDGCTQGNHANHGCISYGNTG